MFTPATKNCFPPFSKGYNAEILVACLSIDEKHEKHDVHCEQDSELKPKSHQAKSAELRTQTRTRLAELRGVDTKLISYPRSNIELEEQKKEIQYLEAEQEFKLQQLAKFAKELIEQENLYRSLKNHKIEDNNNEECRSVVSNSNGNGQIIAMNQVKKNYSVSRSSMAIVDISYREDNEGKSAFWDHYTFQRITGYSTRVVGTTDNGTLLKNVIHDKTFGLPISVASPYKPTPPMIGLYPYSEPNDFHGLLLIPGSHSDSYKCPNFKARMKNEKNLIKDAWNRGRPVLGICAGAWTVWNHFGGKEVKVYDHAFRRMPYLTGIGRVGHNTEMHYLQIRLGSILADAMYGKAAENQVFATLPVANSVHNKAMSPDIVPPNMKITARSLLRTDNAPLNKTPEENVVEAAETCHGAPMLLIQWHPEAYNSNDTDGEYHRSILNYMAKAGDTYCQKQAMLLEMKEKHEPKNSLKGLVNNTKKQAKLRK